MKRLWRLYVIACVVGVFGTVLVLAGFSAYVRFITPPESLPPARSPSERLSDRQ